MITIFNRAELFTDVNQEAAARVWSTLKVAGDECGARGDSRVVFWGCADVYLSDLCEEEGFEEGEGGVCAVSR